MLIFHCRFVKMEEFLTRDCISVVQGYLEPFKFEQGIKRAVFVREMKLTVRRWELANGSPMMAVRRIKWPLTASPRNPQLHWSHEWATRYLSDGTPVDLVPPRLYTAMNERQNGLAAYKRLSNSAP